MRVIAVIAAIGTVVVLVANARGTTLRYRHSAVFTATAYCLSGRTATGTQTGYGVIAVDPRFIRLGTRMYVRGYGTGRALDTGGAIHGYRIDLWMTCRNAVRWGRRRVRVYW